MSSPSDRYGIIADIHSNLAALRAVLDALAREDIGAVLCMGDIVGYGPDPCEVISALNGLPLPLTTIRGNHDCYALGENTDLIRSSTAEAVEYTRRCLSADDKAFLEGLSEKALCQDRILIVHGSPQCRDDYILSREAAAENYKFFCTNYAGINLCFFGHTHLPMAVGDGKVLHDITPGLTLPLRFMTPYMINPGSVGQPRDGNPHAAYAVLDMAQKTVTFKRVPYDVEETHRRMLDAGLPRYLGDRLRVGK
ncbi:MAG: metallophosphoesterase family protein [Planctomycetes bacterium]|nr:metallophosphoesterase family protein [Planctomycetota bacterium]